MPTLTPSVWYVRKNGWVQGPFTSSLMRHMYATSWVGAVDRVATAPGGPWRELRNVMDLAGESADEQPQPVEGGWEVASPLLRLGQPVKFGMLQIYAAAGKLKPTDLVRQLPDGDWQPAGKVEGVFGGYGILVVRNDTRLGHSWTAPADWCCGRGLQPALFRHGEMI